MTVEAKKPFPSLAPNVSPEAKPFWDGTAQGKLMLPKCQDCGTIIWQPKGLCTECGSLKIGWIQASGRGTVYSYSIARQGQERPEFRDVGPYVLAYVELEEGPRIITNIVDCEPESVKIGQKVTVVFHDTGKGLAIPRFRPA